MSTSWGLAYTMLSCEVVCKLRLLRLEDKNIVIQIALLHTADQPRIDKNKNEN